MSLCQKKFPADIGTGSTKYRYVTFNIGVAQETQQDKLTEKASSVISDAKNSLENIGSAIGDSLSSFGDTASSFVNSVKNAFGSENVTIEGGIMLPLPNAMEDNQQHLWEQQEGLGKKIANIVTKGANNLVQGSTLGKTLDVDAEYTLKYLAMQSGTRQFMANPSYWQMYKGSTPRDITFTWIFVPRTSAEATLIQDIIITFKKYSAPEKLTDGYLFKSPYIWTVNFSNPKITNMLALKKLVCTQVQVSYGEGAMSLFKDGMPKYIQMSVAFHECTVATSADFGGSTSSSSLTSSSLGSSLENLGTSGTGSTSLPSVSSTIANSGKYKS